MKLIDTLHYYDYGHEWYLNILTSKRFSLFECVIQCDDYPATEPFPLIIVSIGNRTLAGFTFRWKWIELRLDLCSFAPRNLSRYRREYYTTLTPEDHQKFLDALDDEPREIQSLKDLFSRPSPFQE